MVSVGVISFQIIKLFIVRGEMFLFGILRGKQKSNIFLKSNIFPKSLVKKKNLAYKQNSIKTL